MVIYHSLTLLHQGEPLVPHDYSNISMGRLFKEVFAFFQRSGLLATRFSGQLLINQFNLPECRKGGKQMPCSLTRSDVSSLVLEVIRKKENNPNISENTRFWEDLGVDPKARRGYFRPIKTKVEAAGCTLSKVSPQDFENTKNVKEIVDAVWKNIK